MKLTDTHSHLYDEAFDRDREEALARAAAEGVGQLLLPAIDSESHERLFGLCRRHPQRCIPMMGLHPTSVNDNPRWREELALVERYLETPPAGIRFCAVGEIGLDLYWSRDFRAEQLEAFRRQIDLSLEYGLPIAVHTRDAWPETVELMREYKGRGVRGVFHAFSDTADTYRELKEYALAHPFAGDAKEILYFKYYKPALTGRLLYYYRVYQIESGCPACLRVAEPYYRKAMERAERMMERYLPFYQYYHSGATYRDSYYFLRAKGELSPESGSFVLDEEAEFSTGYDILAARLISVEMLLVHLSRRMERAAQGTETEAVPEKEHRWTNTKVAAILLVYGIHVTGSVDEGNAEIGELAALFEKHFHVDLGNVYHAFGRLRGQQNPTAFLDEMKERLLKKMRDMDSR